MEMARDIELHRSKALLQAELAIAYVLRGGVILSGSVIALGLVLRVFHLSHVSVRSREIVGALLAGGEPHGVAVPHSAGAFLEGLRALDPDTIVALGLALLIALPIVRVGMTVILFLLERDWIYLAITLFVFSVLMTGILFGKAL